ncbi:uncharacterized protein [Haliotis cracherodii]|uniref:uncharacterized protein n=1 Tax=Haliotis cracherodii TaxID=6455 RepID=UPI0039E77124
MTTLKCLAWLLTCTSLLSLCNCQDSVVSVIQRLDQLEEELLDNKGNILRVEQKVLNIIDVAKTSLRAELKETIRDQVKDAMAEILQGESLQDMVKSEVVSELRHLQQGYHQMKRQMHHVSRELKDFKNETALFHDSVLEKANVWNRENSSDVCVREKHKLEIELQKCNIYSAELKTNMELFIVLNETYQTQISQLRTALSVPACTSATANVTSTSKPPVSTTSVTTPRPPVSTASVSTSRQEEEKTRILIAPIWTNVYHKFRQLNIHSNSLTVYQHITRNYVNCLAYISKQRKLLIGSNSPYSILASTLDTG